jgi:hypothetical protein
MKKRGSRSVMQYTDVSKRKDEREGWENTFKNWSVDEWWC